MLFHPFVPLPLIPSVSVKAVEVVRCLGHHYFLRMGDVQRIRVGFRLESERVVVGLRLGQTIYHADKSAAARRQEVIILGRRIG